MISKKLNNEGFEICEEIQKILKEKISLKIKTKKEKIFLLTKITLALTINNILNNFKGSEIETAERFSVGLLLSVRDLLSKKEKNHEK